MEEGRLATKTLAEAEVEDINSKAKEDSKEEDSTTKNEASKTTMEEEDSQEELSNKVEGLEEAKATSTHMISTSNNHLVLQMTAAPLQPTKWDSSHSRIGTAVTTRMHIRISLISTVAQTKDGTDNQPPMEKLSHPNKVSLCDRLDLLC